MSELSLEKSRSARDSLTTILNRLQSIGQNVYAKRIGKGESTISERKDNGYYERFVHEVNSLDCKIVPKWTKTCTETQYPVEVSIIVKARMICAGAVGEDSDFIKHCDNELKRIGVIKETENGELTIPLKHLK